MKKQKVLMYLTSFLLFAGVSWQFNTMTTPVAQAKVKAGDPMPINLFVEMAKTAMPAIVNISTSTMPPQGSQGRLHNDPMFDMLERFWGPGFMPPGARQPRPAQALGSGFIIREDGLIITNNHVIAGADVINVQVGENSEKTYEATVIGRDAATDIALIKIDAEKKLPKLKLGSSDKLEVGEWVAAFGNPFGHAHSMSKGIVSAKGREIGELNRFPFIQTDASINPGNSGGPLVNTRGEVIGVNTAIDARGPGIGFAIPIDSVKSILKQLETKGRIARGYLGVGGWGVSEVQPDALANLDINADSGALVTQVEPGSAAAKAGVEVYDVITGFNGKKVADMQDLSKAVGSTNPGDKATIEVLRRGKKKTLSAKLGERAEEVQVSRNQPKTYKGQKAPFDLGFRVSNMTDEMKQEWGLNPQLQNKPVIVDVERGSPASRAGLRNGDIILDVNRKPVSSSKDVQKALRKGTNALRIVRGTSAPSLVILSSQ